MTSSKRFLIVSLALCASGMYVLAAPGSDGAQGQPPPRPAAGAPAPARPPAATDVNGVYNVRSFGAKGDGQAIDTVGINKAIDAAAAAGGGTVRFPAGSYQSFSIHLKSHVSLYLEHGAVIVAAQPTGGDQRFDAPEPNAWDQFQDFGHSHWRNSLIWGEGLEDVSILGPGLIWGKTLTRSTNVPDGVGNKAIGLKLCRNVVIRDVSILHGGHFAILATGVDNLTVDNVKIDTNRDGIDVDACRNVRISNMSVNSPFDDGICLKASYGLGFARATENVTIVNSQVSGYDEGSFLDGTYRRRDPKSDPGTYSKATTTGRIKFGTESNGGFKNITIANCLFDYSRGLALETVDGGLLEDVTITNITMRDITNAPIFIRLGDRARGPKESTTVGALRRVIISNVIVYNADPTYGSIISGIPGHDIEDLRLSDIHIYSQGGGTAEQAALQPPEKENAYPEPTMFGAMPAYGFYIRHVRGLVMHDVAVSSMKEDLRPPYVLTDVKAADFHNITAEHGRNVPTFSLTNVERFSVTQSWPLPDTRLDRVQSHTF
jgi:polygalacturonase